MSADPVTQERRTGDDRRDGERRAGGRRAVDTEGRFAIIPAFWALIGALVVGYLFFMVLGDVARVTHRCPARSRSASPSSGSRTPGAASSWGRAHRPAIASGAGSEPLSANSGGATAMYFGKNQRRTRGQVSRRMTSRSSRSRGTIQPTMSWALLSLRNARAWASENAA